MRVVNEVRCLSNGDSSWFPCDASNDNRMKAQDSRNAYKPDGNGDAIVAVLAVLVLITLLPLLLI